MQNFRFWQIWLLVVSLYLAVFGLVLAFFNQSSLMNVLFNDHINPVFWQGEIAPENMAAFQAWIYGVLGATVSGWGIAMAFLAQVPFKAREKWAWNAFAASLTIWFVADTLLSAMHGVAFNVGFNVALLLLLGLPLVFTKKHFQ